ncbi:MAG: nucleoside deaminase [Deltaproteobacteria bacterium]|nr:nucleoside deaminase [Deltaproteobacteria bacterium]
MPRSHRAVFMKHALELAAKCHETGDVPVGCVVVKDGVVVGQGYNTREKEQRVTGHAEIMALNDACSNLGTWKLDGCELYVTLEPCVMCSGAIVNARIDTVIFGARDSKAGGVRSLFAICEDPRLNHRVEIIEGILKAECSLIISDFFTSLRLNK